MNIGEVRNFGNFYVEANPAYNDPENSWGNIKWFLGFDGAGKNYRIDGIDASLDTISSDPKTILESCLRLMIQQGVEELHPARKQCQKLIDNWDKYPVRFV